MAFSPHAMAGIGVNADEIKSMVQKADDANFARDLSYHG
jgi:hypothetical protein